MRGSKFYTDHKPFGALKVNERVQRATIPARVKKLVREWNLLHVGAITVSIRDGAAWIIDGQHRWRAAMDLGLGDTHVLCHVYRGLTEKLEAELFLALNDSRAVAPIDKYQVGLVAEDPVCVGVRDTLARYNLRVGSGGSDGSVRCVSKLIDIYSRDSALLDDVCNVLVESWGTRAAALEQVVVAGLGLVLGRYNGELDRSALTKKLAGYRGGPAALAGDARGLSDYKPISVTRAAAEIMVETYNKGRRNGQLSPL